MSPIARRRPVVAALAALGVALSTLAAVSVTAPAFAVGSTGLVINEVYGAGGNSGALRNADFVELYNPQTTAQATDGLTVQYRSAAGTVGGSQALPNVNVPPGGHYLIQMGIVGGTGAALPAPDLVASPAIAMAAAGGQVILGVGTTFGTGDLAGINGITDMVGASGAASFETAATTSPATAALSLNRETGADTNSNANDFSTAAPTPSNSLGTPAALDATSPGNKTGTIGQAITGFTVAVSGGTSPYTWTDPGNTLPPGIALSTNGAISGTPTTADTYNVTLTVTDAVQATDTVAFTFTVGSAPVGVTPIKSIQGTGAASPLTGQSVQTEGVVTASYATGGLNGFYIQTPGADTPDASDAVFVYGGTSGFTSYPAIGASVDVTGTVNEFSGQTQITTNDAGVTPHGSSLGTVMPKTQVPGTDCALPGTTCLTGAALDSAREVAEGEAFQPAAPWTATDVYDGSAYVPGVPFSSSNFGEIGVAADSALPLVTPTEVIDAQDPAKADRIKYNDAHRIVLDDGSSTSYGAAANTGLPLPWLTPDHAPRVGSAITFPAPVVFAFSFDTWKILPTTQVVGAPTATQPQFSQTRADNQAPEDVGGDLKLATFNVLNFFPTTGEEFDAGPGTCSFHTDRAGAKITVDSCNPNGPRGAANDANLARQRAKIVSAINTVDADIVSLEELENSVHFGKPRDFAINALVAALNADAGTGTWAAVSSPGAANLPPLAEQDVIRNGFIYKPATVALVGPSVVLADQSTGSGDTAEAFADGREPLAQAFKAVGTANASAFAVIVNHFKSKGSGTADPDGQGNANLRRELQAHALVAFADSFKTLRGITRVFLAGDFNAYTKEDPIQILNDAGYTNLESDDDPNEESYNFDGQIGSLDHVLANGPALADVDGVDIWTINGYESVYYEYSRFNYNVTDLYQPGPFKSSDHNPEIVGIDVDDTSPPTTKEIQILATNDFHGRLENNSSGTEAGAAVLAGAVKQLREQNPDTVFAAAGDLIGASTFTSFIQNDKPTIDALNEAGLEVSAVGNHELDQGYNDLINRVMAPYDASTNPEGGAEWKYIAANLKMKGTDDPAVPATFMKSFGSVDVGFVGAVTEELPSLVSPAGIEEIDVVGIVDSVNEAADDLVTEGADVIVMLVHEGAPNTNCETMDDSGKWADIINNVGDNVDAIVSGHTHLAYNCAFPVDSWSTRPVTERPVVSAGQYGSALNKLVFSVDTTTGDVTAKTQDLLNLKTGQVANYPVDGPTADIVAAAVAAAAPLGNVELGKIAAPFSRAKFADGSRENRGGESTLGNLVAEVQQWATEGDESGAAQIAFMNPGGLRADMVGVGTGTFPRTLTYKQAADVQPFANTLVNMDLTGAKIKEALEQQWQRNAAGQVPTRPFLKLGMSDGFEYTYDPALPEGSRITSMTLGGDPIDPAATYSVTVNSFLAAGGDNFRAFADGTNKADTGKIDLQAMVDYMAEFAGPSDEPLPVDYAQRAVGAAFPGGDQTITAGESASIDLTSLIMTGSVGTAPSLIADPKDAEVVVSLDGNNLGTFPVDATIPNPTTPAEGEAASTDESGRAEVEVVIPAATTSGAHDLVVKGATTGTEVEIPITVEGGGPVGPAPTAVSATGGPVTVGSGWAAHVTVLPPTATGTVEVRNGGVLLGTATLTTNGTADVSISAFALQPGTHTLTVNYLGSATHAASTSSFTVVVLPAAASQTVLTISPAEIVVGQGRATLTARVTSASANPTGQVVFSIAGTEIGTRTLSGGSASMSVGPAPGVGTAQIVAAYSGDASNAASTSTPKTLRVVKADPQLETTIKPKTVIVGKTKTRLKIEASAPGQDVTGQVRVRWSGEAQTVTLKNGKATVELGKWGSAGEKLVRVRFLGSALANAVSEVASFMVRPKRGG